jgi:hypothetical protein
MNNFNIESFQPVVVENFLSAEHVKNVINDFQNKINRCIFLQQPLHYDHQNQTCY